MRAALYARISRDHEGEALGVARQQVDCRTLAAREGWTVTSVHVDNDISAYTGRRRPAYQALLDEVKNGQVDVIVAWANDRLHRSPRELEDFIDLVEATGTRVVTVTSGVYDLATPEGRAMARVVGAMARAESERKQVRNRRKHEELATAGLPVGGVRPFGYQPGPAPDGRIRIGMTLDPTEAPLVADAARRVLAGETLGAVVRDWNNRGVPTVRGGRWHPTTLRAILMSGRIAGLREHRGEVVGRGAWPAIITVDDHRRLVALFSDRARRTTWTYTRTHCLTGLLWCGRCDILMGSGRRKDRAREYRCARDATRAGCGRMTALAEPLETYVGSVAIARLANIRLDDPPAGDAPVLAEVRQLEDRLQDLNADHYVEGVLPRAEYLMARRQLTVRLDDARGRLAATSRPRVDLPTSRDALEAAWETGGVRWRRAMLGVVLDRVVVGPAVKGRNYFVPDRITLEWRG